MVWFIYSFNMFRDNAKAKLARVREFFHPQAVVAKERRISAVIIRKKKAYIRDVWLGVFLAKIAFQFFLGYKLFKVHIRAVNRSKIGKF